MWYNIIMINKEETIDRIAEELEIALDAVYKYKQSTNITNLNKAYDAVNNSRQMIGSHIKLMKSGAGAKCGGTKKR